ncbi:PTS sugar transporter subunit IIA [Pediococcus acidilactici]|uniref:PTS sugar transporter subunit IIA n=1 Tax=Pediococcus acidilactici TaxID=1254 RepID=UPI00240DD20D|nr:PTS sugar transporter subunit IIA [Pediococcus acidilactici]
MVLNHNEDFFTKEDLFRWLANYLVKKKAIAYKNTLIKDLLHREYMGSTLIYQNFALPHIKAKYILQNIFCIIRFKIPINWNTNKVKVVAFLLVSNSDTFIDEVMNVLSEQSNIDTITGPQTSSDQILSLFV